MFITGTAIHILLLSHICHLYIHVYKLTLIKYNFLSQFIIPANINFYAFFCVCFIINIITERTIMFLDIKHICLKGAG